MKKLQLIKSLLYAKQEDLFLVKLVKSIFRWVSCCFVLIGILAFLLMTVLVVYFKISDDEMLWYLYADITFDKDKPKCLIIGNSIVSALETYHADKGEYPEKLEMLVPDYFEEVPALPVGNKKWQYKRDGKDNFYLLFSNNPKHNYPNCTYVSSLDGWFTDR
jgi:hypothetical protein